MGKRNLFIPGWQEGVFLLFLSACASSPVTQDLSRGANNTIKWELLTVQPDFFSKLDFLAVSEIDGEVIDKPLVFGIDVVLLAPGEHQIKIVLGKFENYVQLAELNSSSATWWAELGTILLREPNVQKKHKGRNYLVASYDKIYTNNTHIPEFMQLWVVNYPRTIQADKKWSIESLDPQTMDLKKIPEARPEESSGTVSEKTE